MERIHRAQAANTMEVASQWVRELVKSSSYVRLLASKMEGKDLSRGVSQRILLELHRERDALNELAEMGKAFWDVSETARYEEERARAEEESRRDGGAEVEKMYKDCVLDREQTPLTEEELEVVEEMREWLGMGEV